MYLKKIIIDIHEFLYEIKQTLELKIMYHLKIMNSKTTVYYIIRKQCSIARYGEGEFSIILGDSNIAFQEQTEELQNKLLEVLNDKNDNLLICIPRCFNSFAGMNESATKWWKEWCRKEEKQKKVVNILRKYNMGNYEFGDALISRPYMDIKSSSYAKEIFTNLKKLWKDKDLLIVEGEQTRLGVGNDLFSDSKSIKRILAPAINAFKVYDHIVRNICNIYDGELILLALGPTATILAAELSKIGMQAIDIGHIDIEYEWYLCGCKEKTAVKGKFTNEVVEGRKFVDCDDENYNREIVMRIEC